MCSQVLDFYNNNVECKSGAAEKIFRIYSNGWKVPPLYSCAPNFYRGSPKSTCTNNQKRLHYVLRKISPMLLKSLQYDLRKISPILLDSLQHGLRRISAMLYSIVYNTVYAE